jgi:hypothetical protein
VPGFVAVEAMRFRRSDTGVETSHLHVPPEGGYFDLEAGDVDLKTQAASDG